MEGWLNPGIWSAATVVIVRVMLDPAGHPSCLYLDEIGT